MNIFFKLNIIVYISIFLLSSSLCAVQKYKIMDLGTLQSDSSRAIALNELGQVAGYYTWKGDVYPFFWDPLEGLMVIDIPKDKFIEISSLSPKYGQIIGKIFNATTKQHIGKFSWDRNAGLHEIPIKLKNGCTLKEILTVTNGHHIIGIYKQNEQEFYFSGNEAKNLPMVFGDLGLKTSITSIVGCASWMEYNNFSIVVANCLFPIVHKGEAVGYIEKAIYWKPEKNWEVKQILVQDRYAYSRVLSINSNGQAICETEQGWKLVDLKKGSIQNMRQFNSARSFNNRGFFLTNEMDLIETSLEKGDIGKYLLNFGSPEVVVNLNDGFWKKILSVNAINDTGYVIGEAETIYSEVHAILLIPNNP